MPTNDGPFDTGYGKPPKRTRFRKGASGNPKGRPKGRLNLATVLSRTLREPIVITVHGRRRVVTKLEAMVKQLTDKALGGDIAAFRQLMALHSSVGLETADLQTNEGLSDADLKLMNRVLERMQRSGKGRVDDGNEA